MILGIHEKLQFTTMSIRFKPYKKITNEYYRELKAIKYFRRLFSISVAYAIVNKRLKKFNQTERKCAFYLLSMRDFKLQSAIF